MDYQLFIKRYEQKRTMVILVDRLIDSYLGPGRDLCDDEEVARIIDEVRENPEGTWLESDARFAGDGFDCIRDLACGNKLELRPTNAQ